MARRTMTLGLALLALAAAGTATAHEADATAAIKAWLQSYDAAFKAKDLERLAAFYHPDVTIFEGGSTNDGWADYRDNHLGPELKEFEGLEFGHFNVTPHVLGGDGKAAYVTGEYRLKARVGGREIDAAGLETLVLLKDATGHWKIRHSHTSSRRRPAATPAPAPHRP